MADPPPIRWFRVDPAKEHYLEPPAFPESRPLTQGDVLQNIPFPVPKHPDAAADERRQPGFRRVPLLDPLSTDINRIRDSFRMKLRMGMLLPHTCEYYEMQAGPGNPLRVLALVRERSREIIPADWNGAFNLFPLPNLLGDGKEYIAQLDTLVTVEEAFLAKRNRVACLSFEGWLALQQRLTHFFARVVSPWDDLEAGQRPQWSEVERDEKAGISPSE